MPKKRHFWTPLSKRLAKAVGFSGQKTLCAECYRRKEKICRLVKRLLGEKHLREEADEYEQN
jgi:hypothetical protein